MTPDTTSHLIGLDRVFESVVDKALERDAHAAKTPYDWLAEVSRHFGAACGAVHFSCQVPLLRAGLVAVAADLWLWLGRGHFDNADMIMAAITEERRKQDSKWGAQNHASPIWVAIAAEELGEVAQAVLHDQFGGKAAGTLRTELVQLAAVVFAWVQCLDRNYPQPEAKASRESQITITIHPAPCESVRLVVVGPPDVAHEYTVLRAASSL